MPLTAGGTPTLPRELPIVKEGGATKGIEKGLGAYGGMESMRHPASREKGLQSPAISCGLQPQQAQDQPLEPACK